MVSMVTVRGVHWNVYDPQLNSQWDFCRGGVSLCWCGDTASHTGWAPHNSAQIPYMHPPPHGGGSSGEEREGSRPSRQRVTNLNDQRMCVWLFPPVLMMVWPSLCYEWDVQLGLLHNLSKQCVCVQVYVCMVCAYMYMYGSIDVCLSMSRVLSMLNVSSLEFVFVWYYTCSN